LPHRRRRRTLAETAAGVVERVQRAALVAHRRVGRERQRHELLAPSMRSGRRSREQPREAGVGGVAEGSLTTSGRLRAEVDRIER
jgi:hypothetical protein